MSESKREVKMVEFDQCEMAVRIAEGLSARQRDGSISAEQCLAIMGPRAAGQLMCAAEKVWDYVIHQLHEQGFVTGWSKSGASRGEIQ